MEKLGKCRFVSYSATIKKGNVEVSANSATLEETNFKSADLNAIVSVRVVNQTTSVITRCQFKGLQGYVPGTPQFKCLVIATFLVRKPIVQRTICGLKVCLGFMEGGDFTGMISIKVLDQNNVKEVTDQ